VRFSVNFFTKPLIGASDEDVSVALTHTARIEPAKKAAPQRSDPRSRKNFMEPEKMRNRPWRQSDSRGRSERECLHASVMALSATGRESKAALSAGAREHSGGGVSRRGVDRALRDT
jgi:hypothetical protein